MLKMAEGFVVTIVMMVLCGGAAAVVGAQDPDNGLQAELPVGKEISATFKEIITVHSAALEDFIADVRYLTTTAQEARLDLIESRQSELTARVNEANVARQELIAQYQDNEISREAFVAALRGLAAEVSAVARSMGMLGEQLAAIGTELAADLQQRADELVAANENMADSMAQAGLAVAQQMQNQGYGPPQDLPGAALLENIPAGPLLEGLSMEGTGGDLETLECSPQVPLV